MEDAAPVIKLTVTQPLAQQLTKEEQRLLDKYAALRTVQLERRNPAEAAAGERKPAAAAEEATKRALAELSKELAEREDGASRPKNRPSRRLEQPAAFRSWENPSSTS